MKNSYVIAASYATISRLYVRIIADAAEPGATFPTASTYHEYNIAGRESSIVPIIS
jgi:predicted MarR family transcription regulator